MSRGTGKPLAAVPDAPRRAGLYVRVSAVMGRSDETFRSPDLQLDAIRRTLPGLGAVEHRVYMDIDRTGTDFQRDGIKSAITDAQAGEIDLLVSYDVARFGRNVAESLAQIRTLRKAGVPLASTVERFDDSPEGQFMLTQFLALAELYAQQLGRRWAQLKAFRFDKGLYTGSTPPLGYCRAPVEGATTKSGRQRVSGPLEPDPVLGPAVAEVFDRYARGEQIAETVRWFSGVRGKPTAKSVVKDMLRNPIYVGRLRTAAGEGPGVHLPLVDEVTWRRVQARLERDRRTPSRSLAVSHSLVGLVRCAHCKYGLIRAVDRQRGLERLHCREDTPRGCCGVGQPQVHQVEEVVLDHLRAYLAELKTDPAATTAARARRAGARADAVTVRHELDRAERALGRMTSDNYLGKLSDAAFKAAKAELEPSIAMLTERLSETEVETLAPPVGQRRALVAELLELWEDEDVTAAERNRMLRQVVRTVEVRKATRWREPLSERTTVTFL